MLKTIKNKIKGIDKGYRYIISEKNAPTSHAF